MIRKNVLVIVLIFMCLIIRAQNVNFATIDSINLLAKNLYNQTEDAAKLSINQQVEVLFGNLLINAGSQVIMYDSLKFIKRITSDDGALSIITWVVPLSQNSFLYSGFVLFGDKNSSVKRVIRLTHEAGNTDLFKSYSGDQWKGAVYQKIIKKKAGKEILYTLFGWVGSEPGTACRIIETLYFDDNEQPVFGKPVLAIGSSKKQSRMIFKFTDRVPFHLAYEKQIIPGSSSKKQEMIVFNRLTRATPEMGLPADVKVPDYAVFDGFIFKGGNWVFVEDIDARMAKQKKSNSKPMPELEISPNPTNNK